jgi:Predicted nucleic-acid-binding protein, contains PIN domain
LSESEVSGRIEFLDANVVIRYLVADVPQLASRAVALIEADQAYFVSTLALAEIGFVLTRAYNVDRALAVDVMIDFLNRENISVFGLVNEAAIEALVLCRRSGRVSFVDALQWAVVRSAVPPRIWTFDARFPADGIQAEAP